MSPDIQQIQRVLLTRKEDLEKEQQLLNDRAAERAAERAANRPSRATARLRREEKQRTRAAGSEKSRPPRPPKLYGERAHVLRTQIENEVVDLLLERAERIAKRGLDQVVEELRRRRFEGLSQVESDAALEYFHEALDKFAAQLAVKEQRTAAPNPAVEWSEAAVRMEIHRQIHLVKAGVAEMTKGRSQSENLQAVCESDRGRLVLLDRAYYSVYLESAKQFCRFLEILREEGPEPDGVGNGRDYCEGWQSELDLLEARIAQRFMA